MTKYECDRCLKLGTKHLQSITVPADERTKHYETTHREQTKDLCEHCVTALWEFVKPLPQVKI